MGCSILSVKGKKGVRDSTRAQVRVVTELQVLSSKAVGVRLKNRSVCVKGRGELEARERGSGSEN